ncbi:retrovirus-related pol polyprotein from transposon TNT 1-94 [Tanacetum coccineum]
MAKASPTQAWLWHRRLSHLNFDYINRFSNKDIVIGLPKLKYVKDQLCSSCEASKAKRSSLKKKVVPSSKRRLHLLHMDLCGHMRVASINGKKYILMKEKGDPCILVGYSTQSKGYRVYNKRTRMIDESIHIRFDEIKEMSETSVANDTSVNTIVQSQQELDLLFGPLYDEFFNACTSSVTKSSSLTDNSKQQDTPPSTNIHPTTEPATLTNVNAEENNSSSRNIDNSNMHNFYQPYDSEYRWTKDHPLKQVRGNPSKPVHTRRQLATDPEMCMFALTVSTAEPKTIKEAMADSALIEAMQEELHQFDRLQVWELIDKSFGKNVNKLKGYGSKQKG